MGNFTGSSSKYLCSFHIPKTGGTTFAHHARTSLAVDEFMQHGPFARAERFMKNQPQLEEMGEDILERLKIIHGHGAGLDLARIIRGRMPEFMVILRDPYERFVSGFNHYNKERKDSALKPVTESEYLELRGLNFYSQLLFKHFKPIAGDVDISLNNLLPILQSFKYLLLTEHMDCQLGEISEIFNLDRGKLEPRRVNKSKNLAEISRENFAKVNSIDVYIYEELEKAATSSAILQNPFGYNSQPLESYLKQAWEQQTSRERLGDAYVELVKSLKDTLKLQAAYLKLARGLHQHVCDSQLLLGMMEAEIESWLAGLTEDKKSMALFWSGVMFMNERYTKEAEEHYRESIRLNPKNDNSLARLAQVIFGRGAREEAKRYIEEAISLRPDRLINQKIYQAILGKTM